MKIAALCATFRRPKLLGQMIECFLRQDHPKHLRELIILCDASQYDNASGDGWTLISIPRRFKSLGEKRNAVAGLISKDVQGLAIWDDDDIGLPHALSTQARALELGDWSRPSLVLVEDGPGRLREAKTGGLYQGGWAFRREIFEKVGGYRAHESNGEDQELGARLVAAGAVIVDPCEFADPFYYYRENSGSFHLSWSGPKHEGYDALGRGTVQKATLTIGWPKDFTALPIKRLAEARVPVYIAPSSGDKLKVELIGPQPKGGNDGPSNGMWALQRTLKARDLDWLTIKPLPPSKGVLAWFWNWQDRGYLARWDKAGNPWVGGPNVIFMNSATPGGDYDERRVLEAKHCRGYFCHSPWYAELIGKHRKNAAPIHQWTYPIEPWPGEPLPDEHDVLIYAKNGWRPGLLEHLAKAYPRHRQIHYGQYRREQLYEAARRSKVCAYLADDDHGPLALQEILLAGCPVIGVRTGASLIQEGTTGVWVPRLPPGKQCIQNDQHRNDLAAYTTALETMLIWDRQTVREAAARQFDTGRIVDQVIECLEQARAANHLAT